MTQFLVPIPCTGPVDADRITVTQSTVVSEIGELPSLRRRALAGVIDTVAVLAPTMAVAAALAERFSFGRSPGGKAVFSLADQQRINEIDTGFNRAIQLNDSLYTLSGAGWWLTVSVLAVMTMVVFAAVPAMMQRRTPGRLLIGFEPESTPIEVERATTDADHQSELLTGQARPEHWDGHDQLRSSPLATAPAASVGAPAATEQEWIVLDQEATSDDTIVMPQQRPEPVAVAAAPVVAEERPEVDRQDQQQIAGPHEPVEAEPTVDVTDHAIGQWPTLADEADYLQWDRLHGGIGDPTADLEPQASTGFDNLALPESSLSDQPLTTTLVRVEAEDQAPGQTPSWSEAWQAWVYRDPTSDRWFRHDPASGNWSPLS